MSFISRVQLRRDSAARRAVASLLRSGSQADSAHRLIWTLFASDPTAERDFLYRQTDADRYLIVSRRPPSPHHELWLSETKPYAPRFAPGDIVGFRLRANPSRSLRSADGARGRRVDATLRLKPGIDDVGVAGDLRRRAALAWLLARSSALGVCFDVEACWVAALDGVSISRDDRLPIRFTAAEFEGVLQVTDPGSLIRAMVLGVGRAKAYGCGLLLARPLDPVGPA